MTKFVKIELNYSGKIYEYKTDLDLKLGGVYRITTDGYTPAMRVKVVSLSLYQDYTGTVSTILTATEAEEF